MEIKTHTNLWNVEKRLYKFYDINLPYPVSVRQIGIFVATMVPWLFLMNVLGVPFSPPWNALWILPPVAFAWYANKPVAEGKTLIDYVGSQLGFYFGHQRYLDLKPDHGKMKTGQRIVVLCSVWRRRMTYED